MKQAIILSAIFITTFTLGGFIGIKEAPKLSPKKFKYVEPKVAQASLEEIVERVLKTTEFSSQNYTIFMIPEAKKALVQADPSLEELLKDEKFWKIFRQENEEALANLDHEFTLLAGRSFYQLSKAELLEYLNLKESPEVKNIQSKITTYMFLDFQKDSQKFDNLIKSLVFSFYEKAKREKKYQKPLESETPPASGQI